MHSTNFIQIYLSFRLRESGHFKPPKSGSGRPRTARTIAIIQRIEEMEEGNSIVSSRAIASVSQSTVIWTLHDADLYPYHFMKVQKLSFHDFQPKMDFCLWYLKGTQKDEIFDRLILDGWSKL